MCYGLLALALRILRAAMFAQPAVAEIEKVVGLVHEDVELNIQAKEYAMCPPVQEFLCAA